MTSRATTKAISATELTEGDSDTLRMRHQLEALAHASPRTPRLVTPIAEGILGAEPSGKIPAAKRSRAASAAKSSDAKSSASKASAPKRARAAKATRTEDQPEAPDDKQVAPNDEAVQSDEQQLPDAPPVISVAPAVVPAAPPVAREHTSRAFAIVAALALATVAAYFSVTGMAEIFPGAPVAVMVFAATMEAGKLVIAGWLAAHWRRVGWSMRFVMVTLVAGLALINAVGVFGKLVEAHVSVAASSRSSVTERIEALDARVNAQSAVIGDLDGRIAQIDRAVDESTRRGRVTRALDIATQQRVTRDGLDTQRQTAMATLVALQGQRAALAGESARIEASTGPIQYLAMMAGTAPEDAVRWLMLLMVLCCDPAAIALTVAASGSRR